MEGRLSENSGKPEFDFYPPGFIFLFLYIALEPSLNVLFFFGSLSMGGVPIRSTSRLSIRSLLGKSRSIPKIHIDYICNINGR